MYNQLIDQLPQTLALASRGRSTGLFGFTERQEVVILSHSMHRLPDGICVDLSGEIDLSTRMDLRRILQVAVATSPGYTNLDLNDVTFLDCAGIAEIVRGHADAQSRRHALTVTRPHGIVRRVLELTDVLELLTPLASVTVMPASKERVPG